MYKKFIHQLANPFLFIYLFFNLFYCVSSINPHNMKLKYSSIKLKSILHYNVYDKNVKNFEITIDKREYTYIFSWIYIFFPFSLHVSNYNYTKLIFDIKFFFFFFGFQLQSNNQHLKL